jgi:hypothetical protein
MRHPYPTEQSSHMDYCESIGEGKCEQLAIVWIIIQEVESAF